MACTAYEILHALYEAIVDQGDLIEHVRGEVLNALQLRFWQLRKAMAHDDTQERLTSWLLEADNVCDAGGFCSSPPSFEMSFTQGLHQATTIEEQNWSINQLGDAGSPDPDIGGMSSPAPVIAESQVSKQLALVKAKITAIVQSTVAVQPGNHLPRWSAQLPAQGNRGPKETKDWPTALYEQKWLRMPPPGWEPHVDFQLNMVHGAQD